MKVTVSKRLQQYLPEHKKDELAGLEANCLDDPKHERLPPVILWANEPKGSNTIVDGHHQWAIRTKHKLKIRYERLRFENEKEAIRWIKRAQGGRRNMSESQLAIMLATDDEDIDTATKAELANISKRTVERAKRVAANSATAVVNGIKKGNITIADAEKHIDLPKAEQTKLARAANKNGSTMAKQKAKISGGTSFDVAEIEAAKPRKAPKSGTPVVSTKTKQATMTNISKLVRQVEELDILDEFRVCLNQLITRVKSL